MLEGHLPVTDSPVGYTEALGDHASSLVAFEEAEKAAITQSVLRGYELLDCDALGHIGRSFPIGNGRFDYTAFNHILPSSVTKASIPERTAPARMPSKSRASGNSEYTRR